MSELNLEYDTSVVKFLPYKYIGKIKYKKDK